MIGPFKQFTSIIGPNGSGKSNLMDAISFVLGVQSGSCAARAPRPGVLDLADKEERRTAYVKLVYEAEDGVETVFSRHITAAGTGEYRVDGRACPAEAYNERLKRHGILVKARNFLVFQGDIESVASKSPKDLTALIEQISGSEDVKKDYEEAMKGRHKAEEDQHAAFASVRRSPRSASRCGSRGRRRRSTRMTEELSACASSTCCSSCSTSTSTRAAEAEIAEAEELRAREARVEAAAREMEEKRRLKASRAKDVLVLERKIASHRAEVDGKAPSTVRVREEMARAKKKLELATKQLERYAADAETGAADTARLGATGAAWKPPKPPSAGAGEEGRKAALDLGEAQMRERNKRRKRLARRRSGRQEREGLANALGRMRRPARGWRRGRLAARSAALGEADSDFRGWRR